MPFCSPCYEIISSFIALVPFRQEATFQHAVKSGVQDQGIGLQPFTLGDFAALVDATKGHWDS